MTIQRGKMTIKYSPKVNQTVFDSSNAKYYAGVYLNHVRSHKGVFYANAVTEENVRFKVTKEEGSQIWYRVD